MAETVTLLNRGRVFNFLFYFVFFTGRVTAAIDIDPENSRQKFIVGRAWSNLGEHQNVPIKPATYFWDLRV